MDSTYFTSDRFQVSIPVMAQVWLTKYHEENWKLWLRIVEHR